MVLENPAVLVIFFFTKNNLKTPEEDKPIFHKAFQSEWITPSLEAPFLLRA